VGAFGVRQKIAILMDLGPSITGDLTSLLAQDPDIAKRGRVLAKIYYSSD
jgi:hypothetical protein